MWNLDTMKTEKALDKEVNDPEKHIKPVNSSDSF